jgi:tight adherence protein C
VTATGVGGVLGLTAGTGLWTLVHEGLRSRRPRLQDRLAPYLLDTAHAGGGWPSRSAAHRDAWMQVSLRRLAQALDDALGGSASVRRRLGHAGRRQSVEDFRLEQVVWGGVGLLAGLGLVAPVSARGAAPSPFTAVVLLAVPAAAAIVARDRVLSAEVRRRERRMLTELPAVADMLALSVGAGEGVVSALARVTALASGDLSQEFAVALAEARAGAPIVDALESLARRTSLPAVERFVDGVAIAVERGTPLADVLRAQAADVRAESRRALLESGGRKEIAMLFPVVFLVLPVTVVFALFPGFANLSLSVA